MTRRTASAPRAVAHLLILLAMCTHLVVAVGISPARTILHAGTDDLRFSFRPVLLEGESGTVTMRLGGDLAPYVALEPGSQDPDPQAIAGTIALPPDLPPGDHHLTVIVALTPDDSAGTVAGKTEAAGQVIVRVPYPERYLAADLAVQPDAGSSSAIATVTLENLGTLPVTPDAIEVTLRDGETPVGTVSLPLAEVAPGGYGQSTGAIAGLSPGAYSADMSVRYADRSIEATRDDIVLGAPHLAITGAVLAPEAGPIRPIDVTGTLVWNRPVAGTITVWVDDIPSPVIVENATFTERFSQRVYLDTASAGVPRQRLTVEARSGDVVARVEVPLIQPVGVVKGKVLPAILGVALLSLVVIVIILHVIWRRTGGKLIK